MSIVATNVQIKQESFGLRKGDKQNRLTIIGLAFRCGGRWRFVCECECGKVVIADAPNIAYDKTTSCGCFHKSQTRKAKTTHGGSWNPDGTMQRLYHTWLHMKDRCRNPKNSSWPWYGAKGIVVREPWNSDFASFREWALANGYADDLSIDRINPDDDYYPENCQWITCSDNAKRSRGTLA